MTDQDQLNMSALICGRVLFIEVIYPGARGGPRRVRL